MKEEINEVKITEKELPKSRRNLSFILSAKILDKFIHQVAEELSKELKVNGFRSGKMPFEIVEKNVGREKLLEEGADRAIRKHYVDYILNKKIEAIGQPEVKIKKLAWGNDFEFEAEVDVLPKVEIADWQEEVKKINKKYNEIKYEVKEEEIEHELKFLAEQRAKIVTVNRTAQEGDQLEMDFDVFQDNVAIEGGSARKQLVIIGKKQFIPGFEENLIGLKAGEEKEFYLVFPKDYHQKHLAGNKAQFKIRVYLIQERQLPEINDEFAVSVGKFKKLEDLKNNLKRGLLEEKKQKNSRNQEIEIVNYLTSKLKIEIPFCLVQSEIEKMNGELDRNIAQLGLNRQQYFQQIKLPEDKIKKQWEENEAPKRIKAALILKYFSEKEKIIPQADKIEERMNQFLQYYKAMGNNKEKIDTQRLYENIKMELANQEVFDWLKKL